MSKQQHRQRQEIENMMSEADPFDEVVQNE